ncbi:MAG: hypothetical protein QXI58_03445 [Candidatus Micrarchaeia archaeon]
MACNFKQRSTIEYDNAKDIFLKFGRRKDYFKIYLNNRLKKGEFIEYDYINKRLSLTNKGIEKIKTILGSEFGLKTYIIKGGEVFTGKRMVEELIFKKMHGEVYICDPYCDVYTLDILSSITEEVSILFLTKQIGEFKKFMHYLNEFKKQFKHIKIEVRTHKDSILHDRFIIVKDSNIVYSIGTSLNGIGKKDCLIIELPKEVTYALIDLFEHRWKEAKEIVEANNKENGYQQKTLTQSSYITSV